MTRLDGAVRPIGIQSIELSDEAEGAYLTYLEKILRGARLNLYYPDARRLQSHLSCMHPAVHRGLYPGVQINQAAGLPTYREWTRVQTDVQIAADQLQKLGARATLVQKAASSSDPIHQKLLTKYDYYHDIQHRALAPLGDMQVALRRVEPERNTAFFHVVLDKLDASGLFVRYVIDLAQTAGAWNKRVVRLDEENAEHTEQFKSLIYKFTALDSEFTFAKLAALGGLSVERVARGSIGPIYWNAAQAPAALQPVFAQAQADGVENAFIAVFSLDMIADDIAEERDNDPLGDSMAAAMPADVQETLARARQSFGVRTFRDAKFVVPRAMIPAMQAFCAAQQTTNIIYGV